MFLNSLDKKISNQYLKNGFVIAKVDDVEKLQQIKTFFVKEIMNSYNKRIKKNEDVLNNFHKYVAISDLNNFRVNIINKMNKINNLRESYYSLSRKYLDIIVGNELSMQKRINLSIQLPRDNSSLLPIHSDTWSGDSPFEVVVWMPLVDCYRTKSMYILSPKKLNLVHGIFKKNLTTNLLFKKIKSHVKWLDVKYGEILIFNQNLPHGNIVNKENETRWSFNCRFKSIFAPYGDKKIGEFFEPITLKPASKIGMQYKYPNIK